VLLHIELNAVVDLRTRVGELAGVRVDDTDLDGVLGIGACRQHGRRDQDGPGE